MKIKKIIKGIEGVEIKGNKDLEVMGLSSHSKLVHPKDLFIAKKAKGFSTSDFIDDAIKSGANAVVTDMYNPFLEDVVQLIHNDPASIESQLAQNYYPQVKGINKYFVTGTNGKTTTCFMLYHLLQAFSINSGLLTTISRHSGQHVYQANLTTDDLLTNYKDIHHMHSSGCTHAVVEASSHGLKQGRLKSLLCRGAIFTNLSHDHLDYHKSMDEYLAFKLKLLENIDESGAAIVNLDCPYFSKINTTKKTLFYSLSNPMADLFVVSVKDSWITLNYQGKLQQVYFDVIGDYNLSNALAAILALLFEGISLADFRLAFKGFRLPQGRLDEVSLSNAARVFIDFAHTPEALNQSLKTLKKLCSAQLYLVFGCGGNRDSSKRADMTRVASQYADQLIFTSDNPRDEDALNIIEDMKKGLAENIDYKVIECRESAINYALNLLRKGDVLCIAGKGHEQGQIIGNKSLPFNDKSVVQKWVKALDLIHV